LGKVIREHQEYKTDSSVVLKSEELRKKSMKNNFDSNVVLIRE